MATQIPKLITNVEPYFRYEGEANATTQDQFQGFLKNEHSVLAVLTKGIWQPTTAYEIGDIIKSPNMPKGFHAIAQTKGNSGANEPTWGTGTTNVSDGTVSWKLSKGDITVNGVGADSNGNIQINNIANATHANKADLATKATNADNATKATQDSAGQTINSTYIKNISSGSGGITITKGNGTQSTVKIDGVNLGNITVTKSTQSNIIESISTQSFSIRYNDSATTVRDKGNALSSALSPKPQADTAPAANEKAYGYVADSLLINTGINAGTYTLQNLLQHLVNKSHSHSSKRVITVGNCRCNCGDSDGSCIIQGNILTDNGYIDIKDLKVSDYIIGIDNKKHKVVGIKLSKLGNRKAVSFTGLNSSVFTDDHLHLIDNGNYGAFDIQGYYRESSHLLTDGNVNGTYERIEKKSIYDLSKENHTIHIYKGLDVCFSMYIRDEFDKDTVTYTPIVEDCEWCIVDGIQTACARYVK